MEWGVIIVAFLCQLVEVVTRFRSVIPVEFYLEIA